MQAAVGLAHRSSAGDPQRLPCQPLDYLTGFLAAFGTMEAILRRHREGGSWHVEMSLERTAAWLWEMADVLGPAATFPSTRLNLDDISDQVAETASPFGVISHLRPALQLTETPGYWARPPVPLGFDPPAWQPLR